MSMFLMNVSLLKKHSGKFQRKIYVDKSNHSVKGLFSENY